MELIIGGSGQGKTACAFRHMKELGYEKPLLYEAEAFFDQPEEWRGRACIVRNVQELARKGKSEEELKRWAVLAVQETACVIFICDEVGCGVVPVEPEERKWREETGHFCCYLAAEAGRVTRVFCGLEQVIKKE